MDYLQYLKKLMHSIKLIEEVLNLVINGLPSIHKIEMTKNDYVIDEVLNLVINGLPSILTRIFWWS